MANTLYHYTIFIPMQLKWAETTRHNTALRFQQAPFTWFPQVFILGTVKCRKKNLIISFYIHFHVLKVIQCLQFWFAQIQFNFFSNDYVRHCISFKSITIVLNWDSLTKDCIKLYHSFTCADKSFCLVNRTVCDLWCLCLVFYQYVADTFDYSIFFAVKCDDIK